MAAAAGRRLVAFSRTESFHNFNSKLLFSTSASKLAESQVNDVQDKETHTGQKWDKDDYRLVRFVDKPKQINERFAIDLIDEVPPKPVKSRSTWCNGGGGPLGHPKVYINLPGQLNRVILKCSHLVCKYVFVKDKPGNHACGYCGLRFYKETEHH